MSIAVAAGCRLYDDQLLAAAPLTGAGTVATSVVPAPAPAGGYGASSIRGSDETRCGDGVISGPEKCDLGIEAGEPGACPTSCPPLAPCAPRVLNGSACQSECLLIEPACGSKDGCCPSHCMVTGDSDCSTACGDGIVQPELGETCEANTDTPCPTSALDCLDGSACTRDVLIGDARNCNAWCAHVPIVERFSGDGCCPERADSTQDVDCRSRCPAELARNACQRCSCAKCGDAYLACKAGPDAEENRLCGAVADCAERERCTGNACFCGASIPCAGPNGPCESEVAAAGHTYDLLTLGNLGRDPQSTLGRASVLDQCRVAQCYDVCLGADGAAD